MDIKGLCAHLKMNGSKTVTIACDNCEKYPGYVRTITIKQDNMVRIEFEVYGYDEGGITYFIQYSDFKGLIDSLEKYLNKTIEEWNIVNQTGYYPEPVVCDLSQTNQSIKKDFVNNLIELPQFGIGLWMPDGYWKDLYNGLYPLA